MRETIKLQDVTQYIGEYLETDVSYLNAESRLATAVAGLDSLKLFEMMLYLEDRLGVEFDDSVMEHIETMSALLAYINDRMTLMPADSVRRTQQ
ncbi:MAG TPA: acyl carrier protein [Thermoanaerobaculia bacterium]|nr:acyl carrier protein [Thermoanaerobaculia bacterium]